MGNEKKFNILAVDDKKKNLIALEAILDYPDCRVIKATSGKEALTYLLEFDVILILLDVHMPEMDGFETAALIRKREKNKTVPIIFLTAEYQRLEHITKGYQLQAVDYLFKPISPDILRTKVSVFVELHRQSKKLQDEIRERKRLENKLELVAQHKKVMALFDGIDDLIYVSDPQNYEILYVNDTFKKVWGNDVIGKKCHQIIYCLDKPCPFCTNDIIFRKDQAHSHVWEIHNKTIDTWFRCSDKAISWPDGRRVRFELASDITEKIKYEQQLQKLNEELGRFNKKLLRSNQELDDFAYIASHDLKEPLRGINNYALFLLEDAADQLDEESQFRLKRIQYLCVRLDAFISDLLTFSRVGRQELVMAETDLNEVVKDILNINALHGEHSVDIQILYPLPTVVCDRVRVGEVFHNLIINAIKYNDKIDKRIEIGYTENVNLTEGQRDHGKTLSNVPFFFVRDNGLGIDPKHTQRIFTIFKRLHGRDEYGGGTGAGLTIVKKIIERHGGKIWVESTPGQGSTFYFTLQGEGNEG